MRISDWSSDVCSSDLRVWPTLSFPALTTEQIGKALAGNTLAIAYHYAHQYGADGKVGGYNIRYDAVDVKKCPRKEIPGDGLLLYEGVCSAQVNEPVTGTWKTEDNKLCVDIAWAGKSQIGRASCRERECQYV